MSNPNKRRGDEYEWAVCAFAAEHLDETGLSVKRTRAGYERDHGDMHVLTPDRALLAVVQAKNRREMKLAEWTDAMTVQAHAARARFGALVLKRPRVADVGRSYAVMPLDAYLRLLGSLYLAETAAGVHLVALPPDATIGQ